MKKLSCLLVLLTTTLQMSFAQSGSGFGIKAGLNYNANGDYVNSFNTNIENPDRNIGYHFGVFFIISSFTITGLEILKAANQF